MQMSLKAKKFRKPVRSRRRPWLVGDPPAVGPPPALPPPHVHRVGGGRGLFPTPLGNIGGLQVCPPSTVSFLWKSGPLRAASPGPPGTWYLLHLARMLLGAPCSQPNLPSM
jgi:hypothetical protein